MKTAISIPDPVFESAEALAGRLGISRSELYAKAVETYIQQHRSQGVTARLNEIYAAESNSLDDEFYKLQQKSLAKQAANTKEEW